MPSKLFHRGAEQVVEGEGFVIVGCDGVWDEMSSEEAVGIVANLLIDYADQPDADIATLFVDGARPLHGGAVVCMPRWHGGLSRWALSDARCAQRC